MHRYILILLIVTITCSSFSNSYAQQAVFTDFLADKTIINSGYTVEDLDLGEDEEKLGTRDFLRDTAYYYTFIWVFRFFYVRNKNQRIFDTSPSKWWDNITQWPETDDGDSWFTNYVTHPFSGAMSFLYYRRMGHGFWGSALGSLVQSTLFEYTIEGLVETPSLPDLIATPAVGVPIGYGLEKTSEYLYNTDNGVAKVAAHILNPMRNFVNDRQIVLLNPLTGQYEFSGQFQTQLPPAKQKSIRFGYPMFFEPALPRGYFRAFLEVQELDNQLNNGEFIYYHIKAEFPSKSNFYSAYIRVSQAGVNNVVSNGVSIGDGFELANILVGGKAIMYKTDNSVYTAGMDLILPLAYKDNVDRLRTIINNSPRDFPLYLRRAITFTPYISTLHYNNWLSIQNNVGFDLVTRADNLEGDSVETRLKYSSAAGVSIPSSELVSPILYAEFDGITTFTADTFKKTGLFFTAGLRIGSRFSPGISIQYPLTGTTADNTRFNYMFDLTIRF